MVSRSIGSCSLPSTIRVTTCGLPTVSSKPSRRMISTRIASCSSPRPCTSQVSGRSVGSTRIETLPTSSASSRLFTSRAVSFLPLSPASGEVLMPTVIEMLGSSMVMTGSGRGSSRSASVSPMVISGMPAMAMMSPGPADSAGTRSSASVISSSVILTRSTRAVGAAPGDGLALADLALVHPAQREAAEVGRRVEVGDVRLQRRPVVVRRCRDRVEDRSRNSGSRSWLSGMSPSVGPRQRRPAGLGRAVDDRELDLLLGRVEVEEQLVGLVDHLGDPGVRPVHLVDDQDHRQLRLQRLAQHEPGLRQRALAGVDEQHDAVDHRQAALDLAAEVGVARGVDDVDGRRHGRRCGAAPRCSWRGS